MLYRDLYNQFSQRLRPIYDDREAATIARYLIEDLTGYPFWSEEVVSPFHMDRVEDAIKRLLQEEPWQYIGGIADFYGLRYFVTPAVLIPRPETEELVYIALDLQKQLKLSSALDVGTGSGVIAVTLAKKALWQRVYALDKMGDALEVAKKNARHHAVAVEFIQSDILDARQWASLPLVDLVVSNPPYILPDEAETMDKNVVLFEPHEALFVAEGAMEFYIALSRFVIQYQEPGCCLLVEIHEKYGAGVIEVFQEAGLDRIVLLQDLQGKDRFVVAEKPEIH